MKRYLVYLMIPLVITAFACKGKKSPGYSSSASTSENVTPISEATPVNALVDSTTFAAKAASGGMMEVQLGELAKKNASSQAVKDFGERMVKDHSKANDELKKVASDQKMDLPKAMLWKNQKNINSLSGKTGSDFDKAYMKMMVSDHKEDIGEFEKAEKDKSVNAKVKDWVKMTLPTLREHLKLAQSTEKKVK